LAEDYNYLFQKRPTFDVLQKEFQNTLEIQIASVELQSREDAGQIEVTLPLPNSKKNEYRLGIGAFVKVAIDAQVDRNQIIEYLKSCLVYFKCLGKYEGNVKLSKVLAKSS
jgi:hypothetical protein